MRIYVYCIFRKESNDDGLEGSMEMDHVTSRGMTYCKETRICDHEWQLSNRFFIKELRTECTHHIYILCCPVGDMSQEEGVGQASSECINCWTFGKRGLPTTFQNIDRLVNASYVGSE